ncbi:MAG: class I SAM-dependent methyltransferase, partial [Bacteroidetes bacterium]|nr:class I SAM-dependent methyltransferase [Bacteroidota bacterium]
MGNNVSSEIGSSLGVKDLLRLLSKKALSGLKGERKFKWSPESVFDASSIPELTFRTYLEMRDLQGYLRPLTSESRFQRSADVGSGFGRLLPLLSDFSKEVVAFEREKDLAEIARRLNPDATVIEISDLSSLESESDCFDFVLVYTVLQHLTDEKV